MENLYLNIDPDLIYYPVVNFNYETGICEITGESYMEETFKFYEPVIHWLKAYVAENKSIILNMRLVYFNTSSSRFILEILDVLKKYHDSGGKVEINWYYKTDDPDILTEINDFMEETGAQIHILAFE